MLNILELAKTKDFFNYSRLYSQSGEIAPIVVTPNPQIADSVRTRYTKLGQRVESVTVSKFIKSELESLDDAELLSNYKGKSELSLLLGAIWKKINSEADYVIYKKAFNLLTELRSFSMNTQVFEEVLEHYDEELAAKVLWLQRFLEEMGIVDEHKSYFLLAERLRAGDLPVAYQGNRNIIFYGFDFMTASQVDLLKSMALRDEVFIPIYKKTLDSSQNVDWINWFDEHNLQRINLSSEFELNKKINIQYFPKGYFSKVLSSLPAKSSYVLGTKDLTRENVQEVPFSNISFKVPVDLFLAELTKIEKELNEEFPVLTEMFKIREYLELQVQLCVKAETFRRLKCLLVVLNKINEWESLSSENENIERFDLQIIFESSSLDLPRVNVTSLMSKDMAKIFSLRNLDELKEQDVILGIHSGHNSMRGVGASYTENVEKYLASIGPIRRAEFETSIYKERFLEFLSDNQVLLAVEIDLLEHDVNWSHFFEGIELDPFNQKLDFQQVRSKIEIDKVRSVLCSLSASRLQVYMDCPQKYYLNYISKTLPRVEFDDELNVLEIGELEHKVIEEYHKNYKVFDSDKHEALVWSLLKARSNKLKIPQDKNEEYFVEVKAYTLPIIEKIYELKKLYNLEATFEFPFETKNKEIQYRGSIDCYLKRDRTHFILDFKRSNYTFTTYSQILDFDKIQLWFYLQRMKELGLVEAGDHVVIGYIDLSNNENSRLITNDKDDISEFKQVFGSVFMKYDEKLFENLEKYSVLETQTIMTIENDSSYLPKPKNIQVCDFCAVKNICNKGFNYGS